MSASISDLARFFDVSPNPYLVLDRDLNIAAANSAYLASVNRELADIVGRWAWNAFPTDEETLKQAIDSFERVKRTGKPDTMALLRFDVPASEEQGGGFEKRYWSITHTPVLDDAGDVAFVLQHPIDVTALETLRQTVEASGSEAGLRREHSGIFDRAEAVYSANQALTAEAERNAAAIATLTAERETLAGLFEQAPSFMALLVGREHRVEFANPGYLMLIGHRPIIGRTVAEALGDAVDQGYLDLLDQVFDSGVAYQANGARYAVQPVPGGLVNERFVDFVFQPFRDREGSVVGIFVQGVDVTERAQEDRFRTMLERLTTLVTRIENPVDLSFEAAALVGETLGASRVGYSRIEHDAGMLVTERDWTAAGVVSLAGRLSLGQFGTFIEDMKRGKIVAINDVRLDPRSSDPAGLEERHARAFLNIPVIERGELVAVFFVNMPDVHAWSEAEIAFIREAAERIRTATERLHSELARQRATDEVRALNATLEQRVAAIAAERDQFWRLSRDPFLICDLEGRWISASPIWTEILGWRSDELIGRTSAWMEHPDDDARTRQEIVDVGGGGITTAFINRFRASDGSYRTFSWTAVSEGDRLFCVARDVTVEMARDEALRRYESIIQSDTAPICAFDPEYRQIAFNQAHSDDFFRTYGHRVHVDEVFPDLLLPEQASMIRGFIDRALAGEMFTVTAEVGDPDLTVPHWELSYGPLKAADGSIVGAFHHAKDVSQRVHMQAELLQTQEVLRQAQKMEAVGQLTGGLAHDFNNLLTGMMGNLELLQLRVARGRVDDLDRFILAAQGAGRRAAALTQRLLAFSRRQTLDPRPTDVNRLVSGMEEMLRRTVGPANTIEVVGAAGLWTANIDAGQLENALLNLCINARDAMPDGGRITIETANKWLDERAARERDLSPGQYLSVCVTDTGTGMTPDIVERVFEPFFTTKPLGEGTGLGLSMIYGFARQSNGQVRVYSEVGSGTTICIYLPRHLGEAVGIDEAGAEAEAALATGETILVVDDEATIRHLIDEVLDDAGYTVIGAADGAAGIKVLQSGARIELLITDVGLPGGMNGRQVADEARRLRPGLKVLFITGYAENAAVGNGHLEPGMELLTKPFTMEGLTVKVAGMLERS